METIFESVGPEALVNGKFSDDCLLVHGCMERVNEPSAWGHYDNKYREDVAQLVTVESEDELPVSKDQDWYHTIVGLPGGTRQTKRIYCHNLATDYGDTGFLIKHLGLKDNGQPHGRGYYMRHISRVYRINKVPNHKHKTASTGGAPAKKRRKAPVE